MKREVKGKRNDRLREMQKRERGNDERRVETSDENHGGGRDGLPIEIENREGNGSRRVGERKFLSRLFFRSSRRGSENTRNSEKITASVLRSAFRSSGASPRRDATRCVRLSRSTMRKVVSAVNGVEIGREITLVIRFTRRSVRTSTSSQARRDFKYHRFFPLKFATDLLHFEFESIVLSPFTYYTPFFVSFFSFMPYRLPFYLLFRSTISLENSYVRSWDISRCVVSRDKIASFIARVEKLRVDFRVGTIRINCANEHSKRRSEQSKFS